MLFKDIVGQQNLKNRLIQTVNEGRISHAQLFVGKIGFGTLPLAIAYAQYITCKNKQEGDSCGACTSCIKFNKLAHPDLHFSFPVNTNSSVKAKPVSNDFMQDWRELNLQKTYFDLDDWHEKIDIVQKQSLISVHESHEVIKKLTLKPFEAEYKMLLIWKAEHMNASASNKLLKLIEEPTGKTIIILIAEDEEALLKTITSRTQLIRVPPIAQEDIKKYLEQKEQIGVEKANQIAALAEGDVLVADEKLHYSEDQEMFFNLFVTWMRGCYEANVEKMHTWVEQVSDRKFGRERQKRFLEYALEVMREGMIRNYSENGLQRFDGAEGNFMKKFAPFVHENNVFGIMEILNDAHYHVSRNAYAKILFMDMSMKFANLLKVKKRTFVR
jgi:DNA polymerase-3 subunit delta'